MNRILMKKIIFICFLFYNQIIFAANLINSSPIGDNVHSEVYTFIKDILINEHTFDEADINLVVQQELNIYEKKSIDKPHLANILENELSHILSDMCNARIVCQEITLYQTKGISIASSSLKKDIIYNKPINKYIKMGFLFPNPEKLLGIKKYTDQNKSSYYEIVQAIYYNKKQDYAYLSIKKQEKSDVLIGYIYYMKKNVVPKRSLD